MGDITRNLSRHEFACDCCGVSEPHPRLVMGIQKVIDRTPGCNRVDITSGSRCLDKQKDLIARGISSALTSKHLVADRDVGGYSLAADCVFSGAKLSEVLARVLTIPDFALGGVGLYVGVDRLHLDVRTGRARWGQVKGEGCTYAEAWEALGLKERRLL